ncbi:MAG: 4-hydroxy-tetrahydrodipicolinate reductase [Eubacteriaceae bacterium]
MLNILLSGVSGAMGETLQNLINNDDDLKIIAGYDAKDNLDLPFPVYSDLSRFHGKPDVIIDFSHFKAFSNIFNYACVNRIPIVIATTGLSEEDLTKIEEESKNFPVFKTANMSLGINLLVKALQEISRPLEDGFDIEIIEKHHNKKIDAPSGTALLLADAINTTLSNEKEYTYGRYGREAKRNENEIGIHALRGGTIPGEHTVIFAGNDEIIEIKHSALSKKVFAEGAIRAAKFLVTKKSGLYDMSMLIDAQSQISN